MKQAQAMVLIRFPQDNVRLFGHLKTNLFHRARDDDKWPVLCSANGAVWAGYFHTVVIDLKVDDAITYRLPE